MIVLVEFVIVLTILAVVVLVVSAPLRRASAADPADRAPTIRPGAEEPVEIAELDAAREAKYREIRDADLDHRTGKLSDADYKAVDQALRAEAVEILRALDRSRGASGADTPASGADTPEPPPSYHGRR